MQFLELVQSCVETFDINKRVEILQRINRLLPAEYDKTSSLRNE
jgi:hypothetical protein